MKRFIVAVAASVIATASLLAQVADGDQHWAARAEGHQGGHAVATHVDAAIAAYQRALGQNPNDLEARWKLLRAMRFKGSYVLTGNEQRKALYGQAKTIGEAGLAVVERQLASRGLPAAGKLPEKKVADAIRSIPNAGELYYWDAVTWGEWALAYGKMAAVRQGAADRIKREATIAMLVDPKLEGGGGARVLGRLHNQTPRVPFVTGWASDEQAVKLLTQSSAQDPSNKITRVFLAEAMMAVDSKNRNAAIKILHDVISTPTDSSYVVEQTAAQDDARALLKSWGAR